MKGNIHYQSIKELSKLIQEQKISPVELVAHCLKRIEAHNPTLNAFITILSDHAREQAKAAEAEIKSGKWRGPLHGIPVGIKDFYDTAGIKTTAAFQYFKDRVPKKDAEGVARLKEAGAIIIGKMNMHQLGMGTTGLDSFFGAAQNPWNKSYIPGGSSSGSAVAVASGLCYATLDTDAIGSCRLPAACCGVVGFKGTYNLISTKGILDGEQPPDEMILWLSHAGITTRSVEDTAIILSVLVDKSKNTGDYPAALAAKKKFRIGVANNFRADQEIMNAFQKAVGTFRSLGYDMRDSAAPFSDPSGGIKNIEADRKAITGKAFKDIDLLLLPVTATTTPTVKEASSDAQALSPENTAFANYYSLPAISIPCGFDSSGMPVSLQIVGKPWDEASVLQLAYEYETATLSDKKHPIG
jgi:aspartyl-tRNA(Asn)/glutamyl-tRNA(Gln) amidotransferase subunit A